METDLANEPFYILLMGTDGSNDREASAEFAGDQFRSDSIILARIDPVDKKATLVSIHRDTLVDMGEYGQNKLNAAHAIGGAALTVKTVSKLIAMLLIRASGDTPIIWFIATPIGRNRIFPRLSI